MAPTGFSHKHISSVSPQPGTKLGESDCDCEVRLEAKGARSLLLSPLKETIRSRSSLNRNDGVADEEIINNRGSEKLQKIGIDEPEEKKTNDSATHTFAFVAFWQRIEQEWAENEKKLLYYLESICDFCSRCDCSNCEDNPDPIEEPCDFGFSEECVEPCLRDTNCCFECWLYSEVDKETRKQEECPL
jgi:hypothetical protein